MEVNKKRLECLLKIVSDAPYYTEC